jgi:type IX secretion system PorP/SprF family membrane protein
MIIMKKHVFSFLVGILLVVVGRLDAQDIHFSQFYMSPLNLNPAMTGVMNCKIRLVGNYRNQWAAILRSNAFNTYSASYDQRFPTGRHDYFGVGAVFYGDMVGQGRFATSAAKISGSYSRRMGGDRVKKHYMVVGANLGLSQRSINFSRFLFGTQHNGRGVGDPSLPSFEELDRDQFLFADMSAGLLWFSILNKTDSWYAGIAYDHLNRPNQSFTDEDYIPLYGKLTLHAGGDFEIGENFSTLPGIVAFRQGPSFQVNFGNSFRFTFLQNRFEEQSFQFGIWARLANKVDSGILMDALILSTRFDYNQFGLGFSYDINTSSLRNATNGNGAFEFSLIYNICGPEDRGVYCPRF